jgi:Fe2+ or Zn2+ uptake regulation protein
MHTDLTELLEGHGIRASAHRLAVAGYVLTTKEHPSADRVWKTVSERFPAISRATVYNTLNLFVEKGLLTELHLDPQSVVFDPKMDTHHHFIDEATGTIHDIPWERVQVCNLEELRGFKVREYQVVMRGTKKK